MATATFDLSDLSRLLGRNLSKQEIERIPLMGTPIEGIDGDCVTIEVFPNRPDMLSIEGFARALSGFLGLDGGLKKYSLKPAKLSLFNKGVASRPFIVGAVVRNVKLDKLMISNLMQLQEKIHDTMGRRRKKIAIGLHDISRLEPPFYYREAAKSESFIPLDFSSPMSLPDILERHPKGRDYAFILQGASKYPILVDSKGNVLSFPPIINGELTRVTDATSSIFVELTGTDQSALSNALNILCSAFLDRGFAVEQVEVISEKKLLTPDFTSLEMALDLNYCNRLLGLDLTAKDAAGLLKKARYGVVRQSSPMDVLVPAYRSDVMHEIDLVEDIAIAYGYGDFSSTISDVATFGKQHPLEVFSSRVRQVMIGFGMNEALSFFLTNIERGFSIPRLQSSGAVEIANPRTSDYTHFRGSLLPSLLEALAHNAQYELPQRLFEIGDAVTVSGNEPVQARYLSVAIVHEKANYSEAKGYLESLARELALPLGSVEPVSGPTFIHGRAAKVGIGASAAIVGEISPEVISKFGIEFPVSVFELDLSRLCPE